jgi:hypothetical protein
MGEKVVRGNVVRGTVFRGNFLGETLLGEPSLGEPSLGEPSLGEPSLGEKTWYPLHIADNFRRKMAFSLKQISGTNEGKTSTVASQKRQYFSAKIF